MATPVSSGFEHSAACRAAAGGGAFGGCHGAIGVVDRFTGYACQPGHAALVDVGTAGAAYHYGGRHAPSKTHG